ncbi:MAG: amidohydrolase family protein [Clostridiales bacterium]|nr:amidohydrolase family protein [Clostridiales bacterium]
MRVDVQCHVFPDVVGKYMLANSFPRCVRLEDGYMFEFGSQKLIIPDFQYKPETLIQMMDKGAVNISVISSNIPDPGFLPPDKAAALCTQVNEAVKAIAGRYPDRFAALGFIPWNNPEASLEEIGRVKAFGMKGIMLFTRNGDLQVDDKRLEPVYDKCEKEGLPLFLHPTIPMWHEAIGEYGMVTTASFVMDTAFAFMRLCHSGVLDRHLELKVVIPHAGGVLPILDGRLSYTPPAARHFIDPNKRTVIETLFSEQTWFDLANPSKNVLKYFKSYIGLDRAMYGTDYPFVNQEDMSAIIDEMDFTEEEKERVNWKNADRLFKLGLSV